jgi:hypothetical protein
MSGMEDRKRDFENKFAFDEELKFRVTARRTKLLAQWAAGIMGLTPEETTAYSQALLAHDMKSAGSEDLAKKLIADLAAKGHDANALGLEAKMLELMDLAKEQILAS